MRQLKLQRVSRMAVVLLALVTSLSGCAAGSRITLLPDQDGHVGSVTVTTARGQQRIDQAYSTVSVDHAGAASKPSPSGDPEVFANAHRALLDAQPPRSCSFIVNFEFDSVVLTPASRKMLPEILHTVREHMPTEVAVSGFADEAGTPEHNLVLSAQRARAVAALLKKIAPDLPIDVQYFGDKNPLVPTRRGVREPRNRRAEIFVL
jgi:outer membrane protein OmpA-like peptidoglycan-associated protein